VLLEGRDREGPESLQDSSVVESTDRRGRLGDSRDPSRRRRGRKYLSAGSESWIDLPARDGYKLRPDAQIPESRELQRQLS
jgi:hypothetical protein